MTDGSKAAVWTAVWGPWGTPHSVSGSATLNARFPGQWFQVEAGLHYNWHRHYDPTLGRYTQPDPLGFVDGPSVYGYVGGSPLVYVDPDGRIIVKAAWKWCTKNPKCSAKMKELIELCPEPTCKFTRDPANHYFAGLGFCQHYQLTCWDKKRPGSQASFRVPIPGTCRKIRDHEKPDLPFENGPDGVGK